MSKLTAMHLEEALGRYLDHSKSMLIPNVHFGGGECDLLEVTRAGYAVEYEIKVSASDWRADLKKAKWSSPLRRFISRFYYVVPRDLLPFMPDIPEGVGVIVVDAYWRAERWNPEGRVDFHVEEARPARRFLSAPKLTDRQMQQLMTSLYYRYWDYRRQTSANKLADLREQLKAEHAAG